MADFEPHRTTAREPIPRVTRRSFMVEAGAAAGAGAVFLAGVESLKFLFPNATNEAPLQFVLKGVQPERIGIDNPYMDYGHRVGILRDDAGIYAVRLICTHLGCTPNFTTDVVANTSVSPATADDHGVRRGSERIPDGWACPCHGSRYFIDSTNFYGPAPRPMDWVFVTVSPSGELFVDASHLVVQRGAGDTRTPRWRMDPSTGRNNGLTLGV